MNIRTLYFAVAAADTGARFAKNMASMPAVRRKVQDCREWIALKHYELGMAVDQARDDRSRENARRKAKIEALAHVDAELKKEIENADTVLEECKKAHKAKVRSLKEEFAKMREQVKASF